MAIIDLAVGAPDAHMSTNASAYDCMRADMKGDNPDRTSTRKTVTSASSKMTHRGRY
jgi:hypothetical protein